jgi:hypothetical protein
MNPQDLDDMMDYIAISNREWEEAWERLDEFNNPKPQPVKTPEEIAAWEKECERHRKESDAKRLRLAHAIIDEKVGAAGLSVDELSMLGWEPSYFGYYGWPTAQENREKAREIIADAKRERRQKRRELIREIMEQTKEQMRRLGY